ncbi:MAG: hypothetical protein HZB53_19210 [Chloroflexi bacterium]|nr:hypothetical protein [Chloroflexota bacterium]
MNRASNHSVDPQLSRVPAADRKTFAALKTPAQIQAFLDDVPYSTDDAYRCPASVLRDRRAHCFDGALFAAAALRQLGYPPLLVNMYARRDDEHLIALFRRYGHWGSIGKSNFVGLRYREPVYRTLRELVMSYFEGYYNMERLRSLREYTRPFNLRAFDRLNWLSDDATMDLIADKLDALARRPILTPRMVRNLTLLDKRSFDAGMVGTDIEGVYFPE